MTGSTGRQRVPRAFLESLEVPIPSLAEQRRIVAEIETVTSRTRLAQDSQIEAVEATARLRDALIDRVIDEAVELNAPMMSLGDVAEDIRYGTSVKASFDPSDGVPVIRMGNIQRGQLRLTDLVFVDRSLPGISRLLLTRGDILVNRTNSPELVGKSALFEEDGEYIFASYIIRIRPDREHLDPRYLWAVLNSTSGRNYFLSRQRRTTGVANINSRMLREMPLPLPDPLTQRQLVTELRNRLAKYRTIRGEQEDTRELLSSVVPALLHRTFAV